MGKKIKSWVKMLTTMLIISAGVFGQSNSAYAAEGDVEINGDNFHSSGLRDYISQFIDKDKDGVLSQNEIDETVEIDFNEFGEDYSIGDYYGIERFENLKTLRLAPYEQPISGFNLSMFPELEYLDCNNVWVSNIDLSKNQNLKYLNCSYCNLDSLDLTYNIKLEHLDCSYNYLYKLDVMKCPNLNYLNCGCCEKLSILDVTCNPKLQTLKCYSGYIDQLDLNKNIELEYLDCSGNSLSQLDLSQNIKLSYLDCELTDIFYLDVSKCNENITVKGIPDNQVVTKSMTSGIEDVEINETNFPDKNFRNFVDRFEVFNNDNCLSASELALVKDIYIQEIMSAKGIEYFCNLEKLFCASNELKEIDLSKNTKLKSLQLNCNKVKSLDLSKNTELEELNCLGTKLTGLDLSNNKKVKKVSFWTYSGIVNLSNHPTLESVHQEGLTTYLNLEGDTKLTNIELLDSDLAKINIKGCTSLKNLNFEGSALTELDLTGCEKIESLQLSMPKLQKLYAGSDSQLTELTITKSEQLKSIDLSGSAKLKSFFCTDCPLVEKLTISNEAPLSNFVCNNTILKELDLSPYSKLDTLSVYGNNTLTKLLLPQQSQLGTIDIQKNDKLTVIQFPQSGKIGSVICKDNVVENADMSGCSEIKNIEFAGNVALKSINLPIQIKSLTLSNNVTLSNIQFSQGCKLSIVNCSDSGMVNIDLSECHELEKAEFTNNASLKSIIFPKSDYLESISCSQNNVLQNIDVSKCKYLLELYCGENALQSLDLQENINLRKLDCNNNQLKELVMPKDLSYDILSSGEDSKKEENTIIVNSLKDINCSSNQLKDLELSECEALTRLDCTKNQIKRIDISSCDELLKRVIGTKEEVSGQVKYVDGVDGGYCLTCDSGVKVITHGPNGKHGGINVIYHEAVVATCEKSGNREYWECNCGKYFSDKACTKEINKNSWVVKATGHSYGTPTYTWSSDNKNVTATHICKNDSSHKVTEKVSTTYKEIKAATESATGTGRYTATFTKEGFTTQTKDVTLEELAHKHSGSNVTTHAAVKATCTKDGNSAYYECSCGKFFSDKSCTKEINKNSWVIKATGHSYGTPTYEWSTDNKTVTATKVCKNDASHKVTETVNTIYKVITEATENKEGKGQYTATFTKEGFEKQTKDVEISKLEPKPSKGDVTKVFKDVLAGEWFVSAVQFVYDNSIMNGVSESSFAPKMTLTREQFITVLYNMEGGPDIEFKQIFEDVKNEANVWYAKSVTWAAENGITSGIGGGMFGTGKEITREQLATLLYNYAQQKEGYKLTIDENAVANFPDAGQISSWATTGMKWAVSNGVMGGKSGKDERNFLDPLGKASRAECAQMIKNLKEKAVK